ncbi:type IV secretory pathway TrbL component [Bradyrhizobium sp. USDA 4501]
MKEQKMLPFENSSDPVSVSGDDGDAVVPGNEARAAAEKEAKATGKPVTIRDAVTDKVLATVKPKKAKQPKAAKAAAKKGKTVKKAKPVKKTAAKKSAAKRDGDAPSGMTAELVKLAMRACGVTPAQLNEHSKWKGAPWKWFFSNPKKTGVADRFGYKLKVERNGRAVTYFLTEK